MAEIIGVKFKESGKLYYFQPNDQYLLTGTKVIVETSRGTECGEVVMERRNVPDDQITHELKKVIREATSEDLKRVEENRAKEQTAFEICEQKILDHKLDMKLVSVEYAFDGSKILFCFTADGRVDFRDLVKDLAGVFHTRIELRQIGVRDEAKMLGGLGICGRPFCCSSFLGDFIPVSIKMAKEQGLSLNPVKISGACGRLMCCLKYEEEAYQDLIKHTPKVGMHVNTPDGKGTVCEVNLITGNLRINMDNMPEAAPRTFNKKQVSSLGDTNELSDAEAAMFSSYVKEEEELTAEEQLELERMMEDDGLAQDERPAANGAKVSKQERPRAEQNRQDRSSDQRQGGHQSGQNRKGGHQRPNRTDTGRERQPGQNTHSAQNAQQNKTERSNPQRQQQNAGQNNRRSHQQSKSQKGQQHRPNNNNGGNNNNKAQQNSRPSQHQNAEKNANHRQGQFNRSAHNSGGQNHNRSHGQHGASEGDRSKHTKSE